MNSLVLLFSKDRALQLDATLRSYLLHCRDAISFQMRVLYTTSSPLHAGQYETLIREYGRYDFIRFLHEQDFRSDMLALLAPFDSVLFLVDDNMFVRDFRLEEAVESLRDNPDALGVSLRLGRNTTYCYTLDKTQRLPEFHASGNALLKYSWPAAEYDFGYPLELSSSVYRTEDMLPYLAGLQFQNPNTLEGAMSIHKNIFREEKPFLLCFDRSVVFSIPLNMVQTMWKNRTGGKSEHSPDSLAELFAQGRRFDVYSYSGFSPEACHQEVELNFAAPARVSHDKTQPLISVVIPCYKQAHYLPEAVESVVNQTYKNWECIIVNDGSPDKTGDVARELISRYPGCDIRLLEKPNSGLADARNTGIREANGDWILPLDSDDMFAADYMERAVEIIQKNTSVNLVTTNEEAFGETPHEWIPNEFTPQRILRENTFIYASLYHKDLWEAAGGYYPGIPWGAEDWNFWIACSGVGIVHKRIPEKLFLYRTHAGTSMRDTMKKHWSEVVAMIHTLHPGLYPAGRLIEDHAIISSAHRDTVARIDSLISAFPDLSMPYFWRGLVHERLGNPDLAQMNYEKSLTLSGKDNWQQELRLLQVKAYSSVSRLRDSLPAGGEHLLPVSGIRDFLDDSRVPEQARRLFEQADEHFLKDDLVQARNSIAQALRSLPNNPRLMIAHGNILLRQGLVEAARKEFLRAKILDPVSAPENLGTDAMMTLAECYAGMGNYKNAVSFYKRVIEISGKQEAADMIRSLRVGIPLIGNKLWSGGVTYIELLFKALHILPEQERPKVLLIVTEKTLNAIDLHTHLFPLADGVIFVGQNIHHADTIMPKPFTHCPSSQELFSEIDFYYPVASDAWPDFCSASWIPDFQHVHLPEFFSPNELQWRNNAFQKIALFAKLLVLSSKDTEKDFRTVYPHSKTVIRILSFHTLMPDEVYDADPGEVQRRYGLPDNFLICSNQFWAHKNHFVLFEALAELKRAGKPVHLVCTGSTFDYRFPDYFSRIQQKLIDSGIQDLVHILGIIPRNEQLQLMRRSTAVVQPSLFEGWSTVVEDARALGKDMILSDLPVHKEQAPQYAVYFERNSRDDLLQKISGCFPTLQPGPDLSREEEARRKGTELVREYAKQFCSIALEAQSLYKKTMNKKIAGSIDKDNSELLSQSPPPITVKDSADQVQQCEVDHGITIIAPDNYTNKSWYEEAKRIFGDDADIAILPPPAGEGFENIRFRKNILFLGTSHHLPGLFNSDEKIRFWNNIPFKKYFYQYEKVIRSFLPDSEQRERTIHKIASEAYAVQDEYDAVEYENTFKKKVVWLPDIISVERIRRGQQYPPLSQRPIDLLFVGKKQGPWYKQRQEMLSRLNSYGASRKLKTVIIDTSYMRFNDVDIIENNYYSQAKVVINPIGTGNFFNIRFFETLAAGCICLQQVDNNGVLLNAFRERYKEYNAVYFTSSDLEQKISSIFSDICRFEKYVSNTHSLLAEKDTGDARFQALGISYTRSDDQPVTSLISEGQVSALRDRTVTVGSSIEPRDKQGIKVSAIVSTYNAERFIQGCLEDLVEQTLFKKGELEIIIVNSNSQQNEETVIKEFQSKYPHIRYIRTEQRETVYAAWNRGIREAKGKYITNANTDDRHRKDALGKMAEIMDENPDIGLVYADVIVTETENQTFENHTPVDTIRQPDFSRETLSLGCFTGPQPMWRRTLHERYGFFDETFVVSGDWEFWLRIAEDTKFLHIPECLGLYFRSPFGAEHRNRDQKHRENNLIVKKYLPCYWPTFERDLLAVPGILNFHGDTVYKIGYLLATLERTETARNLFSNYLERYPDDIRMKKALDDLDAAERSAVHMTGSEHAASVQQTVDKFGIPPLVSVIIPCYNHAQYLPDAIESVVAQTYQNWECIIVNDGSPDKTSEVTRQLSAKYPQKKIILLEKENGGLADARNFGINHAQGKYILPLDADDKIHPEMLQKSVAVLESDPAAGIVYTDAVHCEDGTDARRIIPFRQYVSRELMVYNCFSYCSLYRREAWETSGGYNTNMAWGYEDWDFWLGCIEKGFRITQLSEPLFLYRIKEKSMITRAVQHDAELKARIILNHSGLYNRSQINWAKGIQAQDPDILAIPHKEGVIPGFFEPLPAGLSAQGAPSTVAVRFAAVYCVYDDIAWLTDSLESVYPGVDAIYFLVSDKPWYGQPTGNTETITTIREFPDTQNKIRIIQGSWTNETDQRNTGLDRLKEAGFTYCVVIDADEIYDPAELKRMKELVLSRPDVDCWHVSLDTYWKSYRYRIEPREPLKPPVFVKAGEVRFTQNRTVRGSNHMVIPPETGICHHLSYAHGDDEVLKKISTFSHAREIIPGWFENIWKKWDTDHEMINLHPTHPHAYQKAVEQPYASLPPILRKRYLKDKNIPPAVIPCLTSIIILAHNQWVQTEICLLSIERHTREPHEIIVVDNGSGDETRENLRSFLLRKQNLKVIRNNKNLGFAAGNNQGIAIAQGEFVVLLNNDTIVTSGWLGRMLDIFRRHPETGVVGPMSNYVSGPQLIENIENNTIEEIDSFAERWRREHEGQNFPIYRVVGFCLLTKREVINRIGGLDEQFGSGNFEDDDFCLRATLIGYHARVAQDVFIHHSGSQTFKFMGIDFRESLFRNWELFKGKWGIPLDTPYGAAYQFPPQDIPDISLYAPLPLLTLDHKAGADDRWWEEEEQAATEKKRRREKETVIQVQETHGEKEQKRSRKDFTSIIVLLSKRREYSRKCVESIRAYTKESHEIIFIPPGITYAPPKWLRRMLKENKNYKLIKNTPPYQGVDHEGGFSYTCNLGIAEASGRHIVLVNDAVVVTEDWLAGMLECLHSAEDTGIVGPLSVNTEGQQMIPDPGYTSPDDLAGYARSFREKNRYRRAPVKYLDSFCMLFRHDLTEKAGLFDEQLQTHEFAAHDFCLRTALEDFRNLIAGDVFIYFHGHSSTEATAPSASPPITGDKRAFIEKWGDGPESLLKTAKGAVANVLFLADELLQKGQKENAIAILIEGLQSYPGDERLHHMLAGTLIEEGKFREALDILERMPEDMKQSIKILEFFGSCKEGLGLLPEAEQYADRVLSLNSASPAAWILKGTLAFRKALHSDAERHFQKACESDKGFGEACANLGALKWQNGQKEEALALFKKAFILSPAHEDIVTNYYSASVNLKKLPEAEKPFREAIALYPLNRRLKFVFIDNLLQQHKFNEAIKEMEEGLLTFGIDDNTLEVALKIRDIVGAKEFPDSRGGIQKEEEKQQETGKAQENQQTQGIPETGGAISLCMIVKNEEENIGKALHSIKPAVDEMIVVDTGSTDRTKKIARAFGAKVYEFQWTNDFSAARNFSLSKASCHWILVLDADEVISSADHNRLRELIPDSSIIHHPSSLRAYSFVTRNYVGPVSVNWNPNDGRYREEAGSGWFPSAKVRLFPNDTRIRFDKPVHETAEKSLRESNVMIRKSEIPIHHYGKLDREIIQAKGEEYYQIGKKKLEEQGEQNPQALYEIAIQASELEKFDESLEYWERLIAVRPDFPNAYHGMGTAYYRLAMYEEAHGAFQRASLIDPAAKDPGVMLALCELLMGNAGLAISRLETLLAMHPGYPLALLAITTAYCCEGRKDRGLEYLEHARKTQFTIAPYFTDIAKLLKNAGRFDSAIRLLDSAVETGNTTEETHQLLEAYRREQDEIRVEGKNMAEKKETTNSETRQTLSLCMIVKNEEENIERALLSVKPVVDEMIVVDTGSFDKTRDIAKKLGAKVSLFPWTGNFSDARNFAISQTSGRWILILDADEVISPSDHHRLKELILDSSFILHPSSLPAYSFTTRNYVIEANTAGWTANDGRYFLEEAGSGWYPGEKVRLFPKDSRVQFEFPVHERIEPSLMRAGIEIRKSGIPVHHYGKLDREKARSKAERYYQLGKTKLAETGANDAMALYELAIQGTEIGRYDEALDYLKQVVSLIPDFAKAYQSTGNVYFNTGRYANARAAYKKALEKKSGSRDAVLMYATCLIYTGDAERSLPLLKDLIREHPDFPQAILLLAEADLCLGEKEDALQHLKTLKSLPFDPSSQFVSFAEKLISLGQLPYAVSLLRSAAETGLSSDKTGPLLAEAEQLLLKRNG